MRLNSFNFLIFFSLTYILYICLRKDNKLQNILLLAASCVFYGAWSWKFLSLVFVSIITDYSCAFRIDKSNNEKIRKAFLIASIVLNLSILGFFKYFNFFSTNLQGILRLFGIEAQVQLLNIVLPLGVSFYIFKTLTYTIDVYLKKCAPARNLADYALYVLFFPQMISGPIARARDILPQIAGARTLTLEKFYTGCHLIFWGLFQKVFVADNLVKLVNPVFYSTTHSNGLETLLAVYAFAFQIYCDFAGYSNIATGLGKCMGFETMLNFNLPYFATNPQDFWRRWHISLSTWLRDYLYTPIVISRRYWGDWGVIFAIMVTFILCGLWHGAAWTFVIWGAYWGALLSINYKLNAGPSAGSTKMNPSLPRSIFKTFLFFNVVCLGWMLFKADSLNHFILLLKNIFSDFRLTPNGVNSIKLLTFYIFPLAVIEIMQFRKQDLLIIKRLGQRYRIIIYAIISYLIFTYGASAGNEFIYSQF